MGTIGAAACSRWRTRLIKPSRPTTHPLHCESPEKASMASAATVPAEAWEGSVEAAGPSLGAVARAQAAMQAGPVD